MKASASRLIVNGDLFDFWFEYGRVVPGEHVRVLALLAELVDSGVPVLVMGGNHDWWGGAFMRDCLGIEFHREPTRLQLMGKNVYLAHGDGLGKGDLGYRLLRLVLRGRVTRRLFKWLHPDVGAWVADRVSRTRTEGTAPPSNAAARRHAGRVRFLAAWAAAKLEDEPEIDIVALGHCHAPVVQEQSPGRFYVNSGDWVVHRSYVTIDQAGVPVLHDWQG